MQSRHGLPIFAAKLNPLMSSPLNVQLTASLHGHKAAIFGLCQGQSPRHVLSVGGDGWIVQWDLAQPDPGKLLARVGSQLFSVCQLSKQPIIVAGDINGKLYWLDLEDKDRNQEMNHHKKGVFALRQIGEELLSVGGDGVLSRWNIDSRRPRESLQLSYQSLRCLAYHEEQQWLAVGSSDANIYLLDAKSLEIRRVIHQAHDNSVFCVAFSPDGQHLFSGSRDAHLKVWDLQHAQECVSSQAAHLLTINSLAFHPEGHLFATASRDKHVKIWDASTLQLRKVIEAVRDDGHVNSVNHLYWSSYKNSLISCSDDRTVRIWQAEQP